MLGSRRGKGGGIRSWTGDAWDKYVLDFPGGRMERRRHEFREAVGRLKEALERQESVPVQTREALAAELGSLDRSVDAASASLMGGLSPPTELARRILLADYRLGSLAPMAGEMDDTLRRAVQKYADASESLLAESARRGPEGEPLARMRRTEIQDLLRVLHRGESGEGDGGHE